LDRIARVFFNPTEDGLNQVEEGRFYVIPIHDQAEAIGLLVYLKPQTDGTWGHITDLEASITDLNAKGCVTEMQFYENMFTVHALIQGVQPDAQVFPVTNGDRWITLEQAFAALNGVVACRVSGRRGCCH
jgi:hypothetical protein